MPHSAHKLRILGPKHHRKLDPAGPTPGPVGPPPLNPGQVVVQLLFHTPEGPLVIDGTGTYDPDGSIVVETPPFTPPAPGTIVQIVILGPGDPLISEGVTGDVDDDGSMTINSGS